MLRRLASLKWLALWIACAICYLPLTLVSAIVQPRRPGAPPPRPALLWTMLACAASLALTDCSLFSASPATRPGNTAPDLIKKISSAAHEICDPILGAVDGMVNSYDAPPGDAGAPPVKVPVDAGPADVADAGDAS